MITVRMITVRMITVRWITVRMITFRTITVRMIIVRMITVRMITVRMITVRMITVYYYSPALRGQSWTHGSDRGAGRQVSRQHGRRRQEPVHAAILRHHPGQRRVCQGAHPARGQHLALRQQGQIVSQPSL